MQNCNCQSLSLMPFYGQTSKLRIEVASVDVVVEGYDIDFYTYTY